jgi:DinB superfamily
MVSDGSRGDLDELFGRRSRPAGPTGGTAAPGALNPELELVVRQLADASREAEQLVGHLTEQQFNWSPGAGRWSIAECLGHLNLVGSDLLPKIDAALAEARARAWYRQGPLRVGLLGRWLLEATEPPVRSRRRAKDEHVSEGRQAAGVVLPSLLDLNAQLAARVRAGNGLDLGRPKVNAFGSALYKPSLYELFLAAAAHERRHLRQAQAVRDDAGFPKRVGPPPAAPPRAGR